MDGTEVFGPSGPKLILAYEDDMGTVGKSTVSVKENFIEIEKKLREQVSK